MLFQTQLALRIQIRRKELQMLFQIRLVFRFQMQLVLRIQIRWKELLWQLELQVQMVRKEIQIRRKELL